jgi:S1-C subfamily serine protease
VKKNLAVALCVLSFCSLIDDFVFAGDIPTFTKAIETAKQFVVPIVCFGLNPDNKVPYLISVEGSGFFVSGDPRVLTAAHVGRAIEEKQRIPSCAFPGIYVPTKGWSNTNLDVKIKYVPISQCLVGQNLDIAACNLLEDLTKDKEIEVQPTSAVLDSTIYPDGTPVAFTGFPLSFVQPITSQGIIGTYRGPNALLGPLEMVIDKNAWPGASGSPVYESSGKVVGIIVQRGFNDSSGLAFAIPGHAISKFLADNPPAKQETPPQH